MDPITIGGPREEFRFTLASDPSTTWSLPLMRDLSVADYMGLAAAYSKPPAEIGAAVLDAIIDLFDRLAPGLTSACTLSVLLEVNAAWLRASRVTAGDSSASSD